jgi:hypothetical protein
MGNTQEHPPFEHFSNVVMLPVSPRCTGPEAECLASRCEHHLDSAIVYGARALEILDRPENVAKWSRSVDALKAVNDLRFAVDKLTIIKSLTQGAFTEMASECADVERCRE